MNKELFKSLVEVIATLRGENGCPWDREQTHTSLKSTLIEETYETVEAIDSAQPDKLKEELGDLLLNIMLQAQIAAENRDFDIYDVIDTLTEKLIRRHPHVFGDVNVENSDDVVKNWEAIKKEEAGYEDRESILDGIPIALPSLLRGQKIQKRAARVGFDWDDIQDVISKVDEELAEVKEELIKLQASAMKSMTPEDRAAARSARVKAQNERLHSLVKTSLVKSETPDEIPTAEELQQLLLEEGVKPEDNLGSRAIIEERERRRTGISKM